MKVPIHSQTLASYRHTIRHIQEWSPFDVMHIPKTCKLVTYRNTRGNIQKWSLTHGHSQTHYRTHTGINPYFNEILELILIVRIMSLSYSGSVVQKQYKNIQHSFHMNTNNFFSSVNITHIFNDFYCVQNPSKQILAHSNTNFDYHRW